VLSQQCCLTHQRRGGSKQRRCMCTHADRCMLLSQWTWMRVSQERMRAHAHTCADVVQVERRRQETVVDAAAAAPPRSRLLQVCSSQGGQLHAFRVVPAQQANGTPAAGDWSPRCCGGTSAAVRGVAAAGGALRSSSSPPVQRHALHAVVVVVCGCEGESGKDWLLSSRAAVTGLSLLLNNKGQGGRCTGLSIAICYTTELQ
jgi:hypothetical protein